VGAMNEEIEIKDNEAINNFWFDYIHIVAPVVVCKKLSIWERFKRYFFITKLQQQEYREMELRTKLAKARLNHVKNMDIRQ
jgi:hypothetical protein